MSQRTEDLIKFLRNLRAVREYTPQPIPDDVVNDILEVARWSGSASNKQPTEIVVVRDQDVKQKLADGGVKPAATCAVAFVIVTPGNRETSHIEVFDDGRLVERLLLAAKAHGLGSNIGSLKAGGPDAVKRALGIPAERRVWSVVTVGYTDEEARKARLAGAAARGRRPTTEFVHWDKY